MSVEISLGFGYARARGGSYAHAMKVACPNCPARADLGPAAKDLSDTAYKLLCPILREHQIQKGEQERSQF